MPNAVISEEKAIWLLSFNNSHSESLFLYTTRKLPVILVTLSSFSEWHHKAPSSNDMGSKAKRENEEEDDTVGKNLRCLQALS